VYPGWICWISGALFTIFFEKIKSLELSEFSLRDKNHWFSYWFIRATSFSGEKANRFFGVK
jgi:hypothetical protein